MTHGSYVYKQAWEEKHTKNPSDYSEGCNEIHGMGTCIF